MLSTLQRPHFTRRFNIEHIALRNCDGIELETLLTHACIISHLKHLELSRCGYIESLEHVGKVSGLQTLHIKGCRSLSCVAGLSLLPKLQVLSIRDCVSIASVPSLVALHSFEATGLPLLQALPTLADSLRRLSCSSCWMLQDVSAVATCHGLEYLDLHGCQMLPSHGVPNLCELPRLEHLDISSCPEIDNLDFMLPTGCPGLRSLKLCETAVEDTSVLKLCGSLETINLWGEDIDYTFAGHLLSVDHSSTEAFDDAVAPRSACPFPPATHSPAAAMVIHEWFMREELGDPDFGLFS